VLGVVSRARITQIMSLRNLAPVIQERILALLPSVLQSIQATRQDAIFPMSQSRPEAITVGASETSLRLISSEVFDLKPTSRLRSLHGQRYD
jgi:hypothetical protein